MHFKMSSAICFNLDQSRILSSGNWLMCQNAALCGNGLNETLPNVNEPVEAYLSNHLQSKLCRLRV